MVRPWYIVIVVLRGWVMLGRAHGGGAVVELHGDKATVLIPQIAMMTQIKLSTNVQLEDEIKLKASSIDIVNRLINFKPL